MARFQISDSIEINRPAEIVFQYVNDVSQAPSWRPNLSVRDVSGEPFEVGTTWSEVTKLMGHDVVVNLEITALEAGQHCEIRLEGGAVSGTNTWDISPGGINSCTATLSFDGEISGWLAGLASGMLRNHTQRTMKKDLANLKANLESS